MTTKIAKEDRSFNNVALSDVSIMINDLHFPAHSFVLAAQCDYFKESLTRGLKSEAVKEFRYEENHPHAYWRMLEYLYKGSYSAEPPAEITDQGKKSWPKRKRDYCADSNKNK